MEVLITYKLLEKKLKSELSESIAEAIMFGIWIDFFRYCHSISKPMKELASYYEGNGPINVWWENWCAKCGEYTEDTEGDIINMTKIHKNDFIRGYVICRFCNELFKKYEPMYRTRIF